MAWTFRCYEQVYYENSWTFKEYLELTEVESTRAGYFKIKIYSFVTIFPGPGYTIPERNAWAQYNGESITASPSFPQETLEHSYASATTYIELPNSWNGESIRLYGRIFNWGGVTPAVNAAYRLTIDEDSHVSSYTVTRTSCGTEFGTVGVLNSGDAVYAGDVLEVSAQAESGYEIVGLQDSYTVSGDTEISITTQPTATVHIYDGESWARYSLFVYNGTGWDRYQAKIFNGTLWDNYN